MVVTRIDSAQHPLADEWWALYESAFPATERRRAAQHTAALQQTSFHCLHLADAAGFVGLLSYWQWDSLVYVEHLAINPERRGQGLGHAVLELLPAPAILEIEPVVDEPTLRRLAFYESCGFVRLPQPHIQLAYQAGLPAVPLWLLSRPVLSEAEVAAFEQFYHEYPMQYRDAGESAIPAPAVDKVENSGQ